MSSDIPSGELGLIAADAVDKQALTDLVLEAVRIPSVTPREGDFAKWVCEQLNGIKSVKAELSEIAEGRFNVYFTAGETTGRSLVLAGHLDTVHADDWRAEWHGSDRADPFAGYLIDGEIWARGVGDQKAGICAIIEALRAIDKAGVPLQSSVCGLFVCDEESGQPDSGVSLGMKAAIKELKRLLPATPDFAIYTEPTKGAIYTAQIGFLIADIELTGSSAYFGTPELGVDALKAGHALLAELWKHNEQLQSVTPHPLLGKPNLLVTKVDAGGNIAVPGKFRLSLIQKLLPGDDLDRAAQTIRDIASKTARSNGVKSRVDFSAPRNHAVGGTPDELEHDHPIVQKLAKSVATTINKPAKFEGAPYWSEKSFLSALGVPSVYFAPGDISNCHTPHERLAVDELFETTRALTHFVANFHNWRA